jgi:hypothetical protein
MYANHVDKRADLKNIGFDYDSQSLRHGYELINVPLQTYKVFTTAPIQL